MLVAAVLLANVACSTPPAETEEAAPAAATEIAPTPGIWPPAASPAIAENAKVVALGAADSKPEFCGDSMVFDDSKMTAAPAGYERGGFILCTGEYELPFNIFEITKPGEGFVNNFFEVVSFDGARTRIKIDGEKNQGMVMEVDQDARYAGKVAYKLTADYVGTSFTYGGNIYELGPEGFSVGGKLVHRFADVAP
jgi:hypothetical protein